MNKPSDPSLALALRYLKASERTESELRAHLAQKGVSEDELERVLAIALAKRYVSDQRLVEREVELARGPKKIGRERAKARLLARGADESLVESAVSGYSEAEETENALLLARAKYKETDEPGRVARFLISRGFSEESVRSALSQFFPDPEW